MYKSLGILALALCACSHNTPAPATTVTVVPVTASEALPPHSVVTKETGPRVVDIEFPRGRAMQAMVCSDELDCFKQLTGFCPNGYVGGQTLHGGQDKVVGMIFKCVSDEEKAAMKEMEARQAAEVKLYEAAQRAAQQEMQQAQKKQSPKKK